MLETYYAKFMETIEKLGVELPSKFTLEDLKMDFKRRAFFGFVISITIYPITVMESKDALNSNDIFDENFNKRSLYDSPIFKEMFQLTFPYFIQCGVL